MPGTPLISIVIPCFRQGRYLPGAIDSALAQTHQRVEVIVVNDGSDDNTDEEAARYGDRITYLARQNGGVSAARNAGAAVAQGGYLLFLDADDLLHPEAVARLVATVGADPRALGVMGYREFTGDPSNVGAGGEPPLDGHLLPALFLANLAIHAFLCPRAAFLHVGGFNAALRGSEDWDLWVRIALTGVPVRATRWAGAYYRRAPGSASRNTSAMTRGQAAALLGAWPLVRDRPEFWEGWAPVYLRALYAVRRRARLLGFDRTETAPVTNLIRGLRARRVTVEREAPVVVKLQHLLPGALGDALEAVALGACRVFRPRLYNELSR